MTNIDAQRAREIEQGRAMDRFLRARLGESLTIAPALSEEARAFDRWLMAAIGRNTVQGGDDGSN